MKLQSLAVSEEEVMRKIWELATPVSSAMLLNAFSEEKGWKTQTICTFLSRLVSKGYLSVEKHGTTNTYTALISEEDFKQMNAENLIDKVYGGSIKNMVASLVDSGHISEAEIEELKKWLNER